MQEQTRNTLIVRSTHILHGTKKLAAPSFDRPPIYSLQQHLLTGSLFSRLETSFKSPLGNRLVHVALCQP